MPPTKPFKEHKLMDLKSSFAIFPTFPNPELCFGILPRFARPSWTALTVDAMAQNFFCWAKCRLRGGDGVGAYWRTFSL